MEELLDGLGCRLRGSGMVADSIMMGIVNSAMEQAFEKACSREGVLERLNEKSRFCELAVMQLEWCLKFVEEETDAYVVVESVYERERLVSDLTETRDRIRRRLEETEFAILEKDRLLIERFENEVKLRQALDMRDREIMSLEDQFGQLVRIDDEGRDGGFCELKNSVDEQFFNIKQKLEDERINFANGVRNASPRKSFPKEEIVNNDLQLVDDKGNFSGEGKEVEGDEKELSIDPLRCYLGSELGFEKMGSDIDILKETLDIAFGMMSNAISLSEVRPMEQQWRWAIERDTFYTVFNGFAKDVQEFVLKGEKNNSLVMVAEDHFQLMDDIANLLHELNQLIHESEEAPKTFSGNDSIPSSSKPNFGGKPIPKRANGSRDGNSSEIKNGSSPLERNGELKTSSSQVDEKEKAEGSPKDDSMGQGSHVAEIIRNHESIIRQKSEELNWLKGETVRGKSCSSSVKRENDSHFVKKKMQDMVVKLDNIIKTKMSRRCSGVHHSNNMDLTKDRKLEQEVEDSDLKIAMMEETYLVIFKGLINDLHLELDEKDMESQLRVDVDRVILREMVKECNKSIESRVIQSHIEEAILHREFLSEEIYRIVFHEALKKVKLAFNFSSLECQKVMFDGNLPEEKQDQDLESMTNDRMSALFQREIIQECNKFAESIRIESFFKEDIHKFIFNKAIKDVAATAKVAIAEFQKAVDKRTLQNESPSDSMLQTLESLLKEEIYAVFFREVVKEWKMEMENNYIVSSINVDVYHTFIREAVKDFNSCLKEFQGEKPQIFEKSLWSTNEAWSLTVVEKDVLIKKIEFLSRCLKEEEDLVLNASTELMEQSRLIELVDLNHVNEHTAYCNEIFARADEALGSVSTKLTIAMDHIAKSRVQLKELASSSDMKKEEPDIMHEEKIPGYELPYRQSSLCLAEKNEEDLARTLGFISNVVELSREIDEFEHMVQQKIEWNILRLEEVKHQLELSVEHVTSIRRKEQLYRNALYNRCCNLEKAEIEVNLLGDEVDGLVSLLERLYRVLHKYSPVLKNYFGVMDILNLIRKELERPASQLQTDQ